jgi:hypothetical protein
MIIKINIICFVISIISLLFIGMTIYKYRQFIFLENFIIENLESEANIYTQPSEPTESDIKKPYYLNLKDVSISSIQNYVIRNITNALSNIRPDTKGPPGNIGPPGPAGKPGGIFLHKGPIRSIKDTSLVIDRKTNELFINNQTFHPQQSWILNNDNKIMNLSNNSDCINVDNDGILKVSNCISSEKWNYIGSTGQIQAIKPIGGKNKCLTLKNTPEKGSTNQYSLLVDDCVSSPEQSWNFI